MLILIIFGFICAAGFDLILIRAFFDEYSQPVYADGFGITGHDRVTPQIVADAGG